jgi:Putative Flp pilus-assembly TadE/G-like
MTSSMPRGERGAVAPLVAMMLLGLVALAALVIDGGLLFAERRDLQGMADGAARAGAMAIDEDLLRETGTVRLDPTAARAAAERYLETAGVEGAIRIDADTLSVTVDLQERRPTLMMGLLGMRTVDVAAHAVARPRVGIEEAGG